MFVYNFDKMDLNIKTPHFDNTNELELVVLEQTPSVIHSRTTFPNGLVIETRTEANKIEFKSNKEIKVANNGSLTLDY